MHSTISATQARISIGPMPKLYVYEIEMYQLFQNLISNSLKFRRSQVIPEIKIEACELPGKWQFSITDNGIGIESKDFEKIFQIFQRLHTKQEFDGHGVGLANCKKIVQLHQGEIWVGSSPGVGSTFFFTIPA
jgi:light-regulated signal transduction histidine kinase (bacteriophytochrome)